LKRSVKALPGKVAAHKIRIIGGQWKRTPMAVIDRTGLRPTPDRVRETLFNWIGPDVIGSAVLDLFAGTGALGFEAASRGAAEVTLVERDAAVMLAIRSLKDRLSADLITLLQTDAQSALDQAQWQHKRFDLVLLDPPFGEDWLPRVVPRLGAVLASTAQIYVESETAITAERFSGWLAGYVLTSVRSDRAGQVYYHLFCVEQRLI
jgi:16S rRNA (guanine966-N2)-methyltransferase